MISGLIIDRDAEMSTLSKLPIGSTHCVDTFAGYPESFDCARGYGLFEVDRL